MIDLANLDVVPYPHPALRWHSKPIPQVTPLIQDVARRMIELMHDYRGVGLSANQVTLPWRMFVTCVNDKELVFINPEVHLGRNKKDNNPRIAHDHEGCLSFPGLQIDETVPRARDVYVEALDISGKPFTISGPGMLARVIQHECLTHKAKILTEKHGYVSIKDIDSGFIQDRVLGFDTTARKCVWTKVLDTRRILNNGKKWVSLITNKERRAGKRIVCTEDHLCAITDLFQDKITFVAAKDTENLFVVRYVSQSSHNENGLYNNDQISLIIGSLLGDGCISNRGVFSITQGESQLKYLKWKTDILGGGRINEGKSGYGGKPVHLARFPVTEQTRLLRSLWYSDGKKINSFDLLDEKSLAIWFMDDGCLGHGKEVTLHTEGFDVGCVKRVQSHLVTRFGIESNLNCRLVNGGEKFYLYIKSKSIDLFFDAILPYISDCMTYKIPERYLSSQRLCSHDWNKVKRNYSAKKVLSINARNMESALYDLTTETHNFFANDTLVHNCDHLNGVLFIDHLKSSNKMVQMGDQVVTLQEYINKWCKYLEVQYEFATPPKSGKPKYGTDGEEKQKLLRLESLLLEKVV